MKDPGLNEVISYLAKVLLTERDQFESEAKQYAYILTTEDLLYLPLKYQELPPVHTGINEGKLRLGQWQMVCQQVTFELVYHLGTDALYFLRSIAFGEYDWPQATALEVLCRLYADGKIEEDIIQEIDNRFCEMRFETHVYLARNLVARSKTDERFAGIINQFKSVYFYYALADLGENLPKSNEELMELVNKINTYAGDENVVDMLKEVFVIGVSTTGHALMTRDDLIALGTRIASHDGTEDEVQMLMEIFDRNVPHPGGSNLFYYPENYDNEKDDLDSYNPTVEDVVEKCISYKPIIL